MNEQFEKEYNALCTGSALQWRTDAGVLVLGGEDRSDFLQRMTTNDIKRLKPGQSCVTVLTSPTARTLFVFSVICRENELWLLPARAETVSLERHLRGNIFFMDKVTVRNVTAEWLRARLVGPTATSALSGLGLSPSSSDDTWQDDTWQEKDGVIALHQQKYDLPGYEILTVPAVRDTVLASLAGAGVVILNDDLAYHARRIELGRPAPGSELTPDFSPLESGLAWACAENKGCYTGQEIIARQITYDKVTKNLVALASSAPLNAGAAISVDGKTVGDITSVATGFEKPLSLAIVKRPFHSPETVVTVDGISATVMKFLVDGR